MWDISQALKIALTETAPKKAGRITIYSDAQSAIKQSQENKSNAGQVLKLQTISKLENFGPMAEKL